MRKPKTIKSSVSLTVEAQVIAIIISLLQPMDYGNRVKRILRAVFAYFDV